MNIWGTDSITEPSAPRGQGQHPSRPALVPSSSVYLGNGRLPTPPVHREAGPAPTYLLLVSLLKDARPPLAIPTTLPALPLACLGLADRPIHSGWARRPLCARLPVLQVPETGCRPCTPVCHPPALDRGPVALRSLLSILQVRKEVTVAPNTSRP